MSVFLENEDEIMVTLPSGKTYYMGVTCEANAKVTYTKGHLTADPYWSTPNEYEVGDVEIESGGFTLYDDDGHEVLDASFYDEKNDVLSEQDFDYCKVLALETAQEIANDYEWENV